MEGSYAEMRGRGDVEVSQCSSRKVEVSAKEVRSRGCVIGEGYIYI
jgi:hypothetical protein